MSIPDYKQKQQTNKKVKQDNVKRWERDKNVFSSAREKCVSLTAKLRTEMIRIKGLRAQATDNYESWLPLAEAIKKLQGELAKVQKASPDDPKVAELTAQIEEKHAKAQVFRNRFGRCISDSKTGGAKNIEKLADKVLAMK